MAQIVFPPADLAPGDTRSAVVDLTPFRFDRIRSVSDPLFGLAYAWLWEEFGVKDEMELRETLERRFQLSPRIIYELILVRRGGQFVAVRDHTAILARDGHHAVVHLSHVLVDPAARRTGLAGWLRALPIETARECLAAHGGRITLVAEMEYPAPDDPARMIRLQAYERAGFRKIDPALIHYYQPDFRAPEIIDTTGGARPLPFQLIVRRVGREHERVISGEEARTLVQALYDIYAPQFRLADLAHPQLALDRYPARGAIIALLPPTQC
jgi:GNAT superfamily N-acetyltransferase